MSGLARGVSSRGIIGDNSGTPAALDPVPSIIAFSRSSRYGPVLLRDRPVVTSEFARLRPPAEDAGDRPVWGWPTGLLSLFSRERVGCISRRNSCSRCGSARGGLLGIGGLGAEFSRGRVMSRL